jgi:hypothetical protein
MAAFRIGMEAKRHVFVPMLRCFRQIVVVPSQPGIVPMAWTSHCRSMQRTEERTGR